MGPKGAAIMKAATLINRKQPFQPLIVDVHPESSEDIRIRTSFDIRKPIRTFQELIRDSDSG